MSKRFQIIGDRIQDNCRGDKRLGLIELCDILNELENLAGNRNKENKQLRHDASVLICSNQEYRRVNNELKSFIKKLQDDDGNILLMNGYGYTKSYIGELLDDG